VATILYKEESYQIIGAAYKVFNGLGFGHPEKYYQKALEQELTNIGLPFERERFVNLEYDGLAVGKYFLDFIIRNCIVVELKVGNVLWKVPVKQVLGYLHTVNAQLAIIIIFTQKGVQYKRVVNPDYKS